MQLPEPPRTIQVTVAVWTASAAVDCLVRGRTSNQQPPPGSVDLLVMPEATEIKFKPARVVINHRCIER